MSSILRSTSSRFAASLVLAVVAAACGRSAPPTQAPATAPATRREAPARAYAADHVLVKLAPADSTGGDDAVLARVRRVPGVQAVRRQFRTANPPPPRTLLLAPSGARIPAPDLTRWHRVELAAGEDVEARVAQLAKTPGVEVAEPDYLRRPAAAIAPDPLQDQQWHLAATHVPDAWAYLEGLGLPAGGSHDVVVAVIDTGVDLTHPDLAANLWTNGADGSHGYDAVTGSNVPTDDHGHGTHVAGIIAAQAGNGLGGAGIANTVQIMPIKAAQYSGVLAASDVAEGIQFAVAHGADVINMSFGGYGKSQIEEDALATAFGQAVLVAAAGNDGLANDPLCDPLKARVMYPAGYDWVLGVMATAPAAAANGDRLASFSNYDCVPDDTQEYEVMAPGAQILSTLPGGQYAAWSGTSMAAPVVSGIAALVRTKFSDKALYPSRFVMGQLATTGPRQQGVTSLGGPIAYHAVDALAALTSTPTPALTVGERWAFDTVGLAAANDGNGSVDAGETIDVAVVVRNQWGKAEDVTVQLEPLAAGATGPDPYVTMVIDTVAYGAVGSFAKDDNGLQVDSTGKVTGVANPFRFQVAPGTPNGHVIPFKVTMTARNGYDPADATAYVTTGRFELKVTNGRVLPIVIDTPTTLTPDTLWIVNRPTLVEAGASLTVLPGTKIQFTFHDADAVYGSVQIPSLRVNGTLSIQGTAASPVELLADTREGCVNFPVYQADVCIGVRITNYGTTNVSYARIQNPWIGLDYGANGYPSSDTRITSIDHAWFQYDHLGFWSGWGIGATSLSHSILHKLSGATYQGQLRVDRIDASLLDSVDSSSYYRSTQVGAMADDVVLDRLDLPLSYKTAEYARNAWLNAYVDPAVEGWMRLDGCGASTPPDLTLNYWGTTSTTFIDRVVWDYYDNFSCPKVTYQPFLETAPDTTYPFVADVGVSAAGQPTRVVGAEPATFTVTFNRDMDQTVQPAVSFGPSAPYTDHTVTGAWQGPRTWAGTFDVNALTGDGAQLLRVAGARAADDPWLVTGDDVGRFQFEIVTSGSESMNLQATGGEGYVDLSWTQNDFDLLAGYDVYRATSASGPFTRVNPTIIPPQTKAFRDTTVAPGQPYFYTFTVVKTDMSESQYSNVASATPLDTIPPVLVHVPVVAAPPGLPLSFTADATDNVAVKGVDLWFRAIGTTTYSRRAMARTTGNTYAATIEGSAVASPGLEYYLTATDGLSTVSAGRPEYPYQVAVVDRPVITSVTPAIGSATGGTAVTISGTNFKSGAQVRFGEAVATDVVVVSATRVTCVAPQHFPATVDVTVANADGQSGTLLRAFTFESDVASLSLPALSAGQHAIVDVPINAAGVGGLVAADVTVTFDPAVLAPRAARTGSLTPGWSLATNTGVPGQVRLSMASPGGAVAGSGVLATLSLEVIGAPASASPLGLAAVSLNGGAIPAVTAPGRLDVEAVCSVSGTVVAWSGGGVPGVDLALSGDRLYAARTDAAGAYGVEGVPPGAYALRPSKTDDANGITAYDASLILQHAAGIATLSGAAATAADVDRSGAIDAMDAFYVLQKAAGLVSLPFPGAGVVWEFTPESRTYDALTTSVSGQDFTAVLLGDPSGNWTATPAPGGAGLRALVAFDAPVLVHVTESPPTSGGALSATIAVDPGARDVYSLDLVLRYDAAKGTPVSVARGGAAGDWLVSANLNTPGEIRVSMAGAAPLAAAGEVVVVSFGVTGSAQDVTLQAETVAANESLATQVDYRLTLEHAAIAARFAAGVRAPSAAELSKYDVATAAARDGVVDVEDVVVILRNASGLPL